MKLITENASQISLYFNTSVDTFTEKINFKKKNTSKSTSTEAECKIEIPHDV